MLSLELTRTRTGFNTKDQDTGQEISCFMRRGEPVCMLRDKKTKVYIKQLHDIYLQYVGAYKKCYPGGCREGEGCGKFNNLHVECQSFEKFTVSAYENVRELQDDLELSIIELQSSCDACFYCYSILPEDEDVFLRSKEGNKGCFMDRCDNDVDEIDTNTCRAKNKRRKS